MEVFLNILQGVGLVIIGVLIFELIIFFHEGGHFLSAKLSGVKVNEFALGMGPKLFSFTKGETTYSLRFFPIGGFCAMEGEDEESNNPRAFNNAKLYKRLIIIVSGAFMNIVLGLILMAIFLSPSKYFATSQVMELSPFAYTTISGLQQGDEIISIDGYIINNQMDFSYALAKINLKEVDGKSLQIYKQDCVSAIKNLYYSYGDDKSLYEKSEEIQNQIYEDVKNATESIVITTNKTEANAAYIDGANIINSYFPDNAHEIKEITEKEVRQRYRADFVVLRDGEKVQLNDVDFFTYTTPDSDKPQMQRDFNLVLKDKTFLNFIGETGSETVSVVRMVGDSLWGLVTGEFGFNDISGPVGAASATVEVAQVGLEKSFGDAVLNIIYVMMIITVNLGVVNMLPFPALDGGRFVFLLIEGIFKKPIPRKAEAIVNAVGLIILLGFTLVVTLKDVVHLII